MAAIEKICELSGEYPGWEMYGYKRNHIQIMPKYRKKFRGIEATLHFFKSDLILVDRYGLQFYNPSDWMSRYEPPFTSEKELFNYLRVVEKQYVKQQYDYVLEVNDPALQGDVEGRYLNSTTQPNQVIRRMKRLTRDYNLKVIFHECTHLEWDEENR